jgi:hypothetical protein
LILKPRTRPNAIRSLRQAIDFAEIECDYVPARKWVNEIERSGHELGVTDARFNSVYGQDFLLAILKSVSTCSQNPEEAFFHWQHGHAIPGLGSTI